MRIVPMPAAIDIESIEDWLLEFCDVKETQDGFSASLTPEMIQDYSEWVAACQREIVAQMLETMPANVSAKDAAKIIRRMRAPH